MVMVIIQIIDKWMINKQHSNFAHTCQVKGKGNLFEAFKEQCVQMFFVFFWFLCHSIEVKDNSIYSVSTVVQLVKKHFGCSVHFLTADSNELD